MDPFFAVVILCVTAACAIVALVLAIVAVIIAVRALRVTAQVLELEQSVQAAIQTSAQTERSQKFQTL